MQLDNIVIPWKSGLSRLVSLLDMLKICAEGFSIFLRELEALGNDDELFDFARPGLTEEEVWRIKKVINEVSHWCKLIELGHALGVIKQINDKINFFELPWGGFIEPIPLVELGEFMKMLHAIIAEELRERLFMFVPKDQAHWYEKENGFGVNVSKAFPSAALEIKEAGTCYATGRYTACVFHLMRVLEHGLGALAKDIGLKFYRQSWGGIINKIQEKVDNEISSLNKMPKDPTRTERLTFLSKAAKEFVYFKDGWRNYVMHGEDSYDGPRALSVLNHVSAFMSHLATKLKE